MNSTTTTAPLRVAILINTYPNPLIPSLRTSFINAITAASPNAAIDFYDPIKKIEFPDPEKYDLICLIGGTENMTGEISGLADWVKGVVGWLREFIGPDGGGMGKVPKRAKMMGTCWGHQVICVAFGGVVEGIDKSELGIIAIRLTPAGSSFFNTESEVLKLHEFHKRKVTTPAPGFEALAEDGQIFVNEANTILTLQGHAELDGELARKMLEVAPGYMCVEGRGERAEGEHDRGRVWERVVSWVRE